ncbi:MAG: hypothetical protein U5M23_12410 [Marinagarivorans sp.]|nr:hypothetical protein [Marinagarivorans sp.]
MKSYKNGLLGPDLNRCDIVSYNFGDAEIQFRLPNDPKADDNFVQSQEIVDGWKNSTSHLHFIKSEWALQENVNGLLRRIGLVTLGMDIFSFDKASFEQDWKTGPYSFVRKPDLRELAVDFFINLILMGEQSDNPDISKEDALREWEVINDPSLLPIVKQDILPWYMNRRRQKTNYYSWESIIVIPISDRSIVIAQFYSEFFTYGDEACIITKNEQEAFDNMLREEFFSHFTVKYSPEILAKIKEAEALA